MYIKAPALLDADNANITQTGTWAQVTQGGVVSLHCTALATGVGRLSFTFCGKKLRILVNATLGNAVYAFTVNGGTPTNFSTAGSWTWVTICDDTDAPHTVTISYVSGTVGSFYIGLEKSIEITYSYVGMLGLPGLSEARLIGLAQLIESRLTQLNTRLSQDELGRKIGTVTSNSVVIGAQARMWDAAIYGNLIIQVGHGLTKDGMDVESDWEFIDSGPGYGYRETVKTPIEVAFHTDALKMEDYVEQARRWDTLRSRVIDWGRIDCFNNYADSRELSLWSRDHNTSPDYDKLYRAHVENTTKINYGKSGEGSFSIYTVEFTHSGTIA